MLREKIMLKKGDKIGFFIILAIAGYWYCQRYQKKNKHFKNILIARKFLKE